MATNVKQGDGIYMDRRKRTGVALAAGLLFLFVTEILLLFLAGNSLYKEEPVSYTHLTEECSRDCAERSTEVGGYVQ